MTMPTKEQQLEALDWAIRLCIGPKHEHVKTLQHIRDQIASAEPVAWLSEKDGKYLALSSEPPAREDDAWRRDHGISVTPLYALPEPRAASKIPPFDKQWCERMARLEAGHCIQVGGAQPAPAAMPDDAAMRDISQPLGLRAHYRVMPGAVTVTTSNRPNPQNWPPFEHGGEWTMVGIDFAGAMFKRREEAELFVEAAKASIAAPKIPPFDKEWCERMAKLEAGQCVQVGGAQSAPAVPDGCHGFDVTLDADESETLRDCIGDKETQAVRLQVANGHSGYGLYVSSVEYPDEGSTLITELDPPAAGSGSEPPK